LSFLPRSEDTERSVYCTKRARNAVEENAKP
jgi:hypothetical protein